MYQSQHSKERWDNFVYTWASFVVKKPNVERGKKCKNMTIKLNPPC